MHPDILEVILPADVIQDRIRALADEISRDFHQQELVVICVMKGAVFFAADLIRQLKISSVIDFITVSSYGAGTHSTGVVRLLKDVDIDVEGRHVLLVEDILDSGRTLHYLLEHFENRHPSSLKVCTLLDKPDRRRFNVDPAYTGFVVPDVFVVGYGLDFDQRYRELPFIGELKPEVYGQAPQTAPESTPATSVPRP